MKIYRLVLTAVAFCLLCASIVTLSMGWLTNLGEITPDISFTAGSAQQYTFYKITFDKEGNSKITPGGEIGTKGFNAQDLQFGNITNLYFLESDNYVFYAVKIPATMGNYVYADITYGAFGEDNSHTFTFGNHFKIYDEEGNDYSARTDEDSIENLNGVKSIETTYGNTFVSYSCVLSAQAPDEDMMYNDLNDLFEPEDGDPAEIHPLAKMTKAEGATTYSPAPNIGTDPLVFSATATPAPTEYYLYIKLQPNMDLYKYFIDYLYADMPFYLAYQVGIRLSVSPVPHTDTAT